MERDGKPDRDTDAATRAAPGARPNAGRGAPATRGKSAVAKSADARSAEARSVETRSTGAKSADAKNPTGKVARLYERPRGGQAKAIADLMPEVGRTAFRRFGFVQSSVVSRWPEIVGERHARVSLPEAIRFPPGEKSDGILQLVVERGHATLIQHVVPEIIERVNRFFGYRAVARVKLRQGSVKPATGERTASPAPRTAPPSLRPVPIELGDSLRDIGDPELRAVLESLARSMNAQEQNRS